TVLALRSRRSRGGRSESSGRRGRPERPGGRTRCRGPAGQGSRSLRFRRRARRPPLRRWRPCASIVPMDFGAFFNDPDFQRQMAEAMDSLQGQQRLAWADNAIQLAVNMTVAAINRVNLQGTTLEQAEQIRGVMATVFPEAVTLVREARQGLS